MKILVLLLACAQWTVTDSQSCSWAVVHRQSQQQSVGITQLPQEEQAITDQAPELVVNVYSAPFFCPPCESLKRDMAKFPLIQWVEAAAPAWVTSYPTVHWQTESGQWRSYSGWTDSASFEKELQRFNPAFAKRRSEYRSQRTVKSLPNKVIEREVRKEDVTYDSVPYEDWVTEQVPVTVRGTAVWGGRSYSGRVCSDPNCRMCNSIQGQLSSRVEMRTVRRKVIRYRKVPRAKTQSAVDDPGQAPTDYEVVRQLMSLTPGSPGKCHADLGCGDGRILIEAIRQGYGRAIGVEIDPVKADEARKNVAMAGVDDRVTIITGDVLDFEPEAYGVDSISAYLYPDLLDQLLPKFLQAETVVTPYHSVSGLEMTQHGDVFVYRRG